MFKIGFVQFSPIRCDVAANVATVERLLLGVEADLLVLPELANSGYLYSSSDALVPSASRATAPGRSCRRCGVWRVGRAASSWPDSPSGPRRAVQLGGGGRRGRRAPGLPQDASFRR